MRWVPKVSPSKVSTTLDVKLWGNADARKPANQSMLDKWICEGRKPANPADDATDGTSGFVIHFSRVNQIQPPHHNFHKLKCGRGRDNHNNKRFA